MIREVQASDAKTHFARLLDEVEHGTTIIVTRHGRAIARIVPEVARRQQEIDRALDDLAALGDETGRITAEEILEIVREGRRY